MDKRATLKDMAGLTHVSNANFNECHHQATASESIWDAYYACVQKEVSKSGRVGE